MMYLSDDMTPDELIETAEEMRHQAIPTQRGRITVTAHYTRDSNDQPALPATRGYSRTESLPYVLGEGTVRTMAREIADSIISDARTLHGPVIWITGNAYMPPMRAVADAERVYQADNNRDGELWAWFTEMVEAHLSEADVYLGIPDYDNALYVVDLRRWQLSEAAENYDLDAIDDLNDEWEPKSEA